MLWTFSKIVQKFLVIYPVCILNISSTIHNFCFVAYIVILIYEGKEQANSFRNFCFKKLWMTLANPIQSDQSIDMHSFYNMHLAEYHTCWYIRKYVNSIVNRTLSIEI